MMTTKAEPTKPDWDQIIADWEQSGLSQPDFCRQQKISYNSFGYQRCKRNRQSRAMKFHEIKVTKNDIDSSVTIQFILPDQTKLIVPADQAVLVSVFSALRVVTC